MEPSLEQLLGQAGRLADENYLPSASIIYQQVLQRDPDNSVALLMLGIISGETGRHQDGISLLQRALAVKPDFVEAHVALGTFFNRLGSPEDAIGHCRRAVELEPETAEAWLLLSSVNGALGDFSEAERCSQKAIQLQPDCVDAYVNLGHALKAQNRPAEAENAYREALRINPDQPSTQYHLGLFLAELGRRDEALVHYKTANELEPGNFDTHVAMGSALFMLGDLDGALENYDTALSLRPESAEVAGSRALVFERMGDYASAYEIIQPHVAKRQASPGMLITYSKISKHIDRSEESVALIKQTLSDNGLAHSDRSALHFELGSRLDKAGQYDEAFTHFEQGNALGATRFDRAACKEQVDRVIEYFTREKLRELPRARVDSARPVFIVGMPRSGTSLVEQILASHPDVHGGGELPYMYDLLMRMPAVLGSAQAYPLNLDQLKRDSADVLADFYLDKLSALSPSAVRVTDKLPDNYQQLGLIALLFPNARVIHCVRDPLDTCLSCYFNRFESQADYTFSLDDLAFRYQQYQRLMEHWQSHLSLPVMNVRYEQLLHDPEGQTRDLVKYCDLEWSDKCLNFYETARFVNTLSYEQVRRPLYSSSIGRWRHYRAHLSSLLAAFE